MTKKEKEILHGIIDRSGEKKANHYAIAEALAELFPDNIEEVKKQLELEKEIAYREERKEE